MDTQAKTGVEVERLPELPPSFGLFCGVRLDPPKTTEFWGMLHAEAVKEKCDLFTAEQMRAYATAALAAERAEAVRMRAILQDFVTNLEDEHGGDHFEAECPLCHAIEDARAALSPSQQGEPR